MANPYAPVTGVASTSPTTDRKSTRLNSSHLGISYAVFCLKKNNAPQNEQHRPPVSEKVPDRKPEAKVPQQQWQADDDQLQRTRVLFFFKKPGPPRVLPPSPPRRFPD